MNTYITTHSNPKQEQFKQGDLVVFMGDSSLLPMLVTLADDYGHIQRLVVLDSGATIDRPKDVGFEKLPAGSTVLLTVTD